MHLRFLAWFDIVQILNKQKAIASKNSQAGCSDYFMFQRLLTSVSSPAPDITEALYASVFFLIITFAY